jgi:hypothetical protein
MVKGDQLPRLLTARECAILVLRLIELRNKEASPTTRVRLSELTLRRLWGRNRLSGEFIEEVQEWLSRGGWTLFYAQTTYAAIRTSAVLNWSRLSSNRLLEDLKIVNLATVQNGDFDFDKHLHLISKETETDDQND